MEKIRYDEMVNNCIKLINDGVLNNKKLIVFGHSNASLELIDFLQEKDYFVQKILDNNVEKHSEKYKNIKITSPKDMIYEKPNESVVLVVARAFEAMKLQLLDLGYCGKVLKLVDYNTYSEYSLSVETMRSKVFRAEEGIKILEDFKMKYEDCFFVLCPFSALGDIYLMMSYLQYFLDENKVEKYVIFVADKSSANVIKLFGNEILVEQLSQMELDKLVQGVLYSDEQNAFIAHQDRPYIINLHKALYKKCIPLEEIYKTGVFGLDKNVVPIKPHNFCKYSEVDKVVEGKSVVLSPYAKSVTALNSMLWKDIVDSYIKDGYMCYTNVFGDEKPLENTIAISPNILEMKSVVEKAGTFIGIRSGLCDVIREANCKKIALYPVYNYSDTRWKAIEMYSIEQFENIEVGDDYKWIKI